MPATASPCGNTSRNNMTILCGTAPGLINLVSWLHLSYPALNFQIWLSESQLWRSCIQGADMPKTCGFVNVLQSSTCADFNSIPHISCSIWIEISNLNCNSSCCLGAVAEPFLRGAVFFPCTSMAGPGPGWW